jgi:predicted DCC family thiol-disulfide oxidoreductase YuxK
VEGAHLLIYDGDCGFCTTSANWVSRRWTGADLLRAIPWQQVSAESAAELKLSTDDFYRSAWWIDGALVEGGSRAVARALVATHGPWAVAGWILLVPPISWVAPLGYRLVARYRYRLPGGTPACKG